MNWSVYVINLFMNYRYSVSILFLLLLSKFSAQDNSIAPKYSNEFLAIGVGADALGMGNAFVANSWGASSGYWNPAGLLGVNKWLEVSFMHSEYFAGIAKYDQLSLAHAIDEKSALGFTAIRFGVDDIPNTTQLIDNNGVINYDNISSFSAGDYAFMGSYARKIGNAFSLGGTAKVIYRNVGDFARSWGFGLDAGMKYQIGKHWTAAAMLRDVTSTFNAWTFTLDEQTSDVFLATGNSLPQNGLELTLPKLILGFGGKVPVGTAGFNIGGEIDFDITSDGRRNVLISASPFSIDPHAGMQIGFKELIKVRAGISNIQRVTSLDNEQSINVQPSIGLGLALKGFHLDYAFTDIGDASVALYSHVISIRLKLDKPKNAVK